MQMKSLPLFTLQAVLLASSIATSVRAQETSEPEEHHLESSSEVWGYTMAATILSAIVSVTGVAIFLFARLHLREILMDALGLAVGTFIGNVCFELLPETAEELGFDTDVTACLLGGILAGILLQSVLTIHHLAHGGRASGHAHGGKALDHSHASHVSAHVPQALDELPAATTHSESQVRLDVRGGETSQDAPVSEQEKAERLHLSYINLIADLFHNFVDGLVIGAAFLASSRTGLTTSIAIIAHELPQEIADASVLMHAGFSVKATFALNLLVSLFSIIGGAIVVGAAESSERVLRDSQYLLPFASGLFLYLALCSILPELFEAKSVKRVLRSLLWIAIGVGIMALLMLIPHSHSHEEEH